MNRDWAFQAGKVVIVVLCLYLAYVAGKWGLADYYAEQSYQTLVSWRTDELTLDSWAEAHDALRRALELDPMHPTYHHRMGRLYHLRLRMEPLQRDEWGALAKQHFHESLAVRPYWPLTWANLALVKRDLAEFDNEMVEALVNAATYGPWEPGVHEMLAEVGLPYLAAFSGDAKAAITGSIARGLRSPVPRAPRAVLEKLKQYQASIDQDLAAALESMLVSEEWTDAKEILFTEVSLMLWNEWSPAGRRALMDNIMGSTDRLPVLNLVSRYGKLGMVCPRLPRDNKFQRFCRDLGL